MMVSTAMSTSRSVRVYLSGLYPWLLDGSLVLRTFTTRSCLMRYGSIRFTVVPFVSLVMLDGSVGRQNRRSAGTNR